MSFTSSASLIGCSGRLRSWVSVVVKPLTSSPAMPMTTWVGRNPAISSASWSATAQLSTTAAMSATVPDCMWLRPWRLRPDAADRPVAGLVDLEHERLGELRADVERGARRRRRDVVAVPDAAEERHLSPPRRGGRRRVTRTRRGRRRRRARPRSRLRAPRVACPCPGPSPGGRRRGRRCWSRRCWTSEPAAMPRATRSSLTVTNSCGSSASRPRAITPLGNAPRRSLAKPLSASMDSKSPAVPMNATPGAELLRASRRGRRASGGRRPAPPALSRCFVVAQLLLERGDPLLERIRRPRADGRGGPLERVEPVLHERVGGRARDGLDPAHPGADALLAGDDEAADLARRAAVRPAAQLVAEALDADRADPLAVLLVEERVGARRLGLGHRHPLDADRAVVADDAPRTSRSIARFSSSVRPRSNGKSNRR